METLFFQAVQRGFVSGGDADALNFLAAGIRANEIKDGDPTRVFMGLIKRRLWGHLTQAQEDRAAAALRRFREKDPNRFRLRPSENAETLSRYEAAKMSAPRERVNACTMVMRAAAAGKCFSTESNCR